MACGGTFTAYTSSKAGVHGLARVVAADYASEGIRSTPWSPGYTETPLVQTIANDPEQRAGLVNSTMLGRAGTAADVEGIMVYLASDDSTYATGGIFTIDGGLTASKPPPAIALRTDRRWEERWTLRCRLRLDKSRTGVSSIASWHGRNQ